MKRPDIVADVTRLPVTVDAREGRFLSDRYQLLKLLGRGGMGEVWSGLVLPYGNQLTPHRVAIKLLDPDKLQPTEVQQRKEWVKRFENEAAIMRSLLPNGNLVSLLDFSVHRTPDIHRLDIPFQVLELVEGLTSDALRPMELPQALRVVSGAAWGLVHCHRAGVIHRDVSPDNIMVDLTGGVKILDLGVALQEGRNRMTQMVGDRPRFAFGKLGYMSPEQLVGGKLDHRTDIYSLGVVLIELITGHPVFTSNPTPTLDLALRERKILQNVDSSIDVPDILRPLLRKMLAFLNEERAGSLERLVFEMEEIHPDVSKSRTRSILAHDVHLRVATEMGHLSPSGQQYVTTSLSQPFARVSVEELKEPGPPETKADNEKAAAPHFIAPEHTEPERASLAPKTERIPIPVEEVRRTTVFPILQEAEEPNSATKAYITAAVLLAGAVILFLVAITR